MSLYGCIKYICQGLALRDQPPSAQSRIAAEMMTEKAAVNLEAVGVFAEVCPPQLQGWPVGKSIWPAELLTSKSPAYLNLIIYTIRARDFWKAAPHPPC